MSSGYPKISIITPSYNDAAFLERTILSILNQSYPNLEYIIIDGGSTDGSVDIIKKYESQISYWVSEKDGGQYYAIQKGFEKSTGEVMGWINSDDMHHPGSLFILGQIFSEFREVNWLQGMPNVMDENNRIVYSRTAKGINRFYFYQKKHVETNKYIQQESTFWRRCLWEKAGNYISTSYSYAGDFDLWIRFFKYDQLYNISAFLGSFRYSKIGQASIDHHTDYISETMEILKNNPLNKEERRKFHFLTALGKVKHLFSPLFNTISLKFGLIDHSVLNERLHFDNHTQQFKL